MNIILKDFQQNIVDEFIKHTTSVGTEQQIILHSPTGSGKTIILLAYIEQMLKFSKNTIFFWACPGKGELEEQSKNKMDKFFHTLKSGELDDILLQGFEPQTTYFINWERVTKKGNKAITDGEQKNLFERIKEAHNNKFNFIVIVDEEHQNDTDKSQVIIDALTAKYEIRVSATPKKSMTAKLYEIKELDVINEGLITKALYVNEGIDEDITLSNPVTEADILLEMAINKRNEIHEAYKRLNKDINPLILVQFPNLNDELIQAVEDSLNNLGYNHENKMVASWFSEENSKDKQYKSKKLGKINIGTEGEEDSITNANAKPQFLLFKQALATGWDCPRAKILVKLRENMSESFEIQTLGRLRRMPEACHYDEEPILNYSFLYTFDEDYKNKVLEADGTPVQRVFIKDKAKGIKMHKQLKNKNFSTVDEKKIRSKVYNFLVEKYKLTNKDYAKNKSILETHGYIFKKVIMGRFLQGMVTQLNELANISKTDNRLTGLQNKSIEYAVNTHDHGIYLRMNIDKLKQFTGLNYDRTRMMLETLFRLNVGNDTYKLLKLNLIEFYAFIINNISLLSECFKEFSGLITKQLTIELPKEIEFKIPETELYPFDPRAKLKNVYDKNVYKKYNKSMVTHITRSKCEMLFEDYCERNDKIKFVYKNGDVGQQYLSIIYHNNFGKQMAFYPDYIVMDKENNLYIIEAKGGEINDKDLNIDEQAKNKFEALKEYARIKNYKFAFIRYINNDLFYSNTEYKDDMYDSVWTEIDKLFD